MVAAAVGKPDAAFHLPQARTNFSMVAHNGFLYVIGGFNSAGTPQSTVYIAKLGASGEPQLWNPTWEPSNRSKPKQPGATGIPILVLVMSDPGLHRYCLQ